jgi:predicted nucleic acid-binding protein
MAWCFADEGTAETANVQQQLIGEAALVPSHWHLEIANVLAMAEKRKRISTADATNFVRLLGAFDIQTDDQSSNRVFEHVLPLCRAHGLTSYDAAYLELAIRAHLPLASLDEDLRVAATSLGVQVIGI